MVCLIYGVKKGPLFHDVCHLFQRQRLPQSDYEKSQPQGASCCHAGSHGEIDVVKVHTYVFIQYPSDMVN